MASAERGCQFLTTSGGPCSRATAHFAAKCRVFHIQEYRAVYLQTRANKMPPPGKKRRVEDRDYLEPYNASVPTTSRARALAENKAAQVAIQQERASVRIDENGRAEPAPLVCYLTF